MCTNPRTAFKIRDEWKPLLLNEGLSPTSINCISFNGCWLTNSGEYYRLDDEFSYMVEALSIDCRRCKECRLDYAKQWALRCMLEYQSCDCVGCFITLTYDNEHLPSYDLADCSKDFQDFMKRLRKKFDGRKTFLIPILDKETGEITNKEVNPIRYYHCGEYGAMNGRPHHHAILFNFDFPDKKLHRKRNGYDVYYSKELLKLWSEPIKRQETYKYIIPNSINKRTGEPRYKTRTRTVTDYIPKGKVEIGTVTFKSCSYVARYICKKQYGAESQSHYGDNKPEYVTMSRNPGIGKFWFDKYFEDLYKRDSYKFEGYRYKPPKAFDNYFEQLYPEVFEEIKAHRKELAMQFNPLPSSIKEALEQLREREARDTKLKQSTERLVRNMENDFDIHITDTEKRLYYNDSCFHF